MSLLNGVIMQYFQWYNPSDGTLWNEFRERVPELAAHSFTAVWLPPSKGQGECNAVGYGVHANMPSKRASSGPPDARIRRRGLQPQTRTAAITPNSMLRGYPEERGKGAAIG